MKLPFSFGTNLLFRMVLPGLILAGALAPGIEAILQKFWAGTAPDPLSYIPLLVVFSGWMISLADMPIYMAFEGRGFWPERLRRAGLAREAKRLRRLLEEAERARQQGDLRRHVELSVRAAQFPLDAEGEPHAAMPTRLGNLIYEYELYPLRKYGLDSVFFYYRIWIGLDEDLREEIDSKQSAVDGALYVAAALVFMALCLAVYGVVQIAAGIAIPWLGPGWLTLVLAPACLALAYAIYRLSLHAHAQYGEFYKALFDQHRDKLRFDDVLEHLREITGDPDLADGDLKARNMAVWRYLRWHRVRLSGEEVNRNLEAVLRERRIPATPAERPREPAPTP